MLRTVVRWALVAAAVALGWAASLATAADRPNVLFICVDDLKPLLGCYGDAHAQSPNIDRLARQSVLFDRAYCNQAVCSPSRNALLAGLRPQRLGIYDLGTNFRQAVPEAVTLPQHFRQHGYRTEALGKLFHVGHGNHEDPKSWSVPHWKANVVAYALKESKPDGLTREEALFGNSKKDAKQLPRGAPTEKAPVADNVYPDGAIADEAVRRLKAAQQKPDEPFFLAVGFLKPHLPFCAPAKYWDLYKTSQFQLPQRQTAPDGAPDFAPTSWGELRQYAEMPQSGPLTDEQALHLIHGYHAAVSYMDAQLGRVLDALDETGLAENTIVMLWGDHGWHLGDHGMWCKHSNYEQAARIPFLLSAPKAKAKGVRTSSLMESVDVYPTLCELAGLPIPKNLDGKSCAAVLSDPKAATKESIIHVYPRRDMIGRALRTSRHRLVEWKKPGADPSTAVLELYDYESDPNETKNLADAQPELVAKLRKQLNAYDEAQPQIRPEAPRAESPDRSKSKKSSGTDRGVLFKNKDKDGDGYLTRDEFLAKQPDPDKAPARFPIFDANQDGKLSRDEFVHSGKVPKQ